MDFKLSSLKKQLVTDDAQLPRRVFFNSTELDFGIHYFIFQMAAKRNQATNAYLRKLVDEEAQASQDADGGYESYYAWDESPVRKRKAYPHKETPVPKKQGVEVSASSTTVVDVANSMVSMSQPITPNAGDIMDDNGGVHTPMVSLDVGDTSDEVKEVRNLDAGVREIQPDQEDPVGYDDEWNGHTDDLSGYQMHAWENFDQWLMRMRTTDPFKYLMNTTKNT